MGIGVEVSVAAQLDVMRAGGQVGGGGCNGKGSLRFFRVCFYLCSFSCMDEL